MLVCPLLLFLVSQSALAFSLNIKEYDQDYFGNLVQQQRLDEILGYDEAGQPILLLDPRRTADKAIIEMIKPGIPIDQDNIQRQIAQSLDEYPQPCKDRLNINLVVAPVSDIDTWLPNVKDKRRIQSIRLFGCLKETPSECHYSMLDNGAFDFDIGDLQSRLRRCSEALHRDIAAGKALDDPYLNKTATPAP